MNHRITVNSKDPVLDSERKKKPGNVKRNRPLPQADKPWPLHSPAYGVLHGMADPGPGVIIYGDVLPAQIESVSSHWTSEKALMAAVLEQARKEYAFYFGKTGVRRRRMWAETDAWFRSDDLRWPFSFVNICLALGLDVELVRKAVLRDKELKQEVFFFTAPEVVSLPVRAEKWCAYGKHLLPATQEFFPPVKKKRNGRMYLMTYCRTCKNIYDRKRYWRMGGEGEAA
jgi:hypothetical protein